ncbi:single-stranded-DNA-specific exonuclease RecJ [Gilvimarinus sp. SDUM040013]|uniref:Single-stranded-DNA-specific exonuclease RecJ n=1 Tax=Gilvimarinus gilvus TaxID=3058038 RepID=A0ABU4RVA9_9GAMM|nr:single-stranded-DNA-specific exonuclease RecJ [Gilvimarinus sp. SDUM040013]MDO3387004.1 single-stranded-DNA-specific exonuclease RecJ [Gilvimarinus sp. SDUM040013]MDX6848102.1 single-stranded-DNA-specific exonuclease RecJ [Gilvimarinus sp. SDUM040013]
MQKLIKRRAAPSSPLSGTGLPPLLERLYAVRGVSQVQELDLTLKRLFKPTMKGLEEAAAILADAVVADARLLIVGDFDADGATSSALSVLALHAMGARHVDFLVPNRFEYGYGLTPEIVEVAAGYQPDVIITVDNGISSLAGVAAAQQLGIAVVVTDHHLPGAQLPQAEAIVNPNQPGCEFPSKNLAGVGVIFYVMNALKNELVNIGWFKELGVEPPNMANYLDLVALGTVADVVPLDSNNRILVEQGLRRIRAGVARPGILALLEVAGRAKERLVASDLGFAIGPRLNAAGRLDDMSIGIQCLLTDNPVQARELAAELDGFNRDRKAIESGMQREAFAMLDILQVNDDEDMPWGLCLYDASWHQGVIGILASRIKDRFHRPVIVFADSDEGEIKGSARSIPGLHIRDALDAVAARHPELLQKFGGHAMAAGMSIKADHYQDFCHAFDSEIKRQLCADDLQAVLLSDGELEPAEFALDLAHQLRDAGPWGQQFPEPLFDGDFYVVEQRIVGEKHLKLLLAVDEARQQLIDAIAFNVDTALWPNSGASKLRLAYKLNVNEYRGRESVQLLVDYIEAL